MAGKKKQVIKSKQHEEQPEEILHPTTDVPEGFTEMAIIEIMHQKNITREQAIAYINENRWDKKIEEEDES